MIDFRQRAWIPEKMDDLRLDDAELKRALSDIGRVNRLLGGDAASLSGFRRYLGKNGSRPLKVVDLGCGDGAFLRLLASRCRSLGIKAELIGWDMNPKSLQLARNASASFPEIRYECRNVLDFPAIPVNSHVVCNLFLHHFSDQDIARLINNWIEQGSLSILINDLHRHPLAYYLFRLFGAIFMRSGVARHDGAASIRRGFRKGDLRRLLTAVPDTKSSIKWRWAFRWLCSIEPNEIRHARG